MPTAAVHASYLRAMEEHIAEGRGLPGDGSNVGQYIRQFGKLWAEPGEFQRFIDSLLAQSLADTPRPSTYVPTTSLWWVDGDEYLGRLGIRHRLAPGRIGERNGHIGYDVRPSARRQGHATAAVTVAEEEVHGVNDRAQLAAAERMMQDRLRRGAMAGGATLVAPETVFFSHDTRIGRDVVIVDASDDMEGLAAAFDRRLGGRRAPRRDPFGASARRWS